MYSLPQAGLIAQELLEKRLNARGYYQSKFTPGLWTHETRNTKFALVVDDFGIKYESDEDAQHLINLLKSQWLLLSPDSHWHSRFTSTPD
jgi:hypothetical protein